MLHLHRQSRIAAAGLVLPLVLLVLWQIASTERWISPLFYPTPTEIGRAVVDEIRSGQAGSDTLLTLKRLAIGFVFGAAPGVLLGLLAAVFRFLRHGTYPLASALYVVPRVALLPLVLVAFGINDTARIFLVSFSAFFMCFFSTLAAAEQVPATWTDVARAHGASRLHVIRTVIFPASLPGTFTGLRIALGYSVVVIISTEFLAADDGLGARIWLSYEIFDFPTMYAGIVMVTAIGVALTFILVAAEALLLPWRRHRS